MLTNLASENWTIFVLFSFVFDVVVFRILVRTFCQKTFNPSIFGPRIFHPLQNTNSHFLPYFHLKDQISQVDGIKSEI